MPKYRLLIDGERVDRAASEREVRDWLARYREKHAEDDPDAAHVQILETSRLSFVTGGRLVPPQRFL
jgi:hypothetical protein